MMAYYNSAALWLTSFYQLTWIILFCFSLIIPSFKKSILAVSNIFCLFMKEFRVYQIKVIFILFFISLKINASLRCSTGI